MIETTLEDFAKNPELIAALREQLESAIGMDQEQMGVDIDCPYAQYVEFGSDPFPHPGNVTSHVKDPVCGDEVTEVNLRIREWAQSKFNLDDEGRKKRGDALYHKIMDEGMQPTPFIRVARYVVTADMNEHPDRYFQQDKNTSELVANELAAQMAYALNANKSIVTGDLMRGIRVVRLTDIEGKPEPEDLKEIPEYVWEDVSLDRHGNKIKPKNR